MSTPASDPSGPSAAGIVDPRRATIILVAMAVSTFLFVLVEGLPGGLLTLMAPDLNTTTSRIGLLVTGYALVVLVTTVPLARITQHIPRRWVLSATVLVAAAATLWAGLAGSYGSIMTARLVTALAQALFWVAVIPGTTGLFPPRVRGRVVARLALGNSIAPVLGLPVGTWLAEQTHWRVTFWVVSALSTVIFVVVVMLFPTVRPSEGGASRAPFPSRPRLLYQLVTTALIVTSAFGLITFVTQFLQDVAGYERADMPWLLVISGAAGVVGAFTVGRFLDRHSWGSLTVGIAVVAVAQVLLFATGAHPVAAIAGIALFGCAFSTVPPALSHRVMLVAPGSTDMGVAVSSATFNLGIAAGSALGAALTAAVGVRWVPFVGAVLAVLALGANLLENRFNPPFPAHRQAVDEALGLDAPEPDAAALDTTARDAALEG
ncbi:major facilitator superfamily MFS_1 [Xylanimonas cellulosilytica DSM 15894]|uniref:Major facilitator superfamily MFS_1 n=1 Tax=Xylanimonas cellulosilytica (strain DSM 15894 / JCM 12276 / CECT 5975 / KCTC 9989 / LMG 20990 / NBRC 107835 / XIL07) TaxID=446471 RepID=D1BTZ5_XYLCX|nr:MFS transporter [Xylanimonas cellulosilytica]ACZ29159.1 major facilitator superfamily MFS_1 [Xylanimonas cellulosilytica DSM 15894]